MVDADQVFAYPEYPAVEQLKLRQIAVTDNQALDIRDLEIKPEIFTPPDQIREWVRAWPTDLKIDPAALMGQPPEKK
jgi:hypothetical protein